MLKPIQRIPQYKLLLQGKALNSWGTMPLKQEAVIYHWNKIVLFLSALVTSVKFSMRIWFLFSFIEIHLFQSTCNFHDESCQSDSENLLSFTWDYYLMNVILNWTCKYLGKKYQSVIISWCKVHRFKLIIMLNVKKKNQQFKQRIFEFLLWHF